MKQRMWDFAKYATNTAVISDDGIELSYEDLGNECRAIANAVGRRRLAFVLCKNCAGSVIGYAAFVNSNIVPLLLNSRLEKGSLRFLLDAYKPSFLWIPEEDTESFERTDAVYKSYGYVLLKTDYNEEYPMSDELCLLLTTSGSTGSPKFVRQSYANVKSNADSIVEYLKLDETERPITTLPMNYTYGLSIINSHFMVGATLLVTERSLTRKEFWDFFREKKATSFGGVPYTYEMLDRMRFYRMDLPSLKTMTQAGGKLSSELHRKFAEYAEKNGRNFVVMYGQCEATARMGYLPPNKALEKCGYMGIAIPGGRFWVEDANGKVVSKPNVTGELVYEGENVSLGYAESGADLAKGDERCGVLHTGDMAQFDEDGYYCIVGRKKRFLKIYGNRVNLDEIDRMIKNKFSSTDCASAGIDDHMYIFITDDSVSHQIKDFVVFKTGLNQVAFQVIALKEIPKNDSGKTLYKELEKYYP